MNLQIQILQYLEAIRSEFLTVILTVVTIMAEKVFLVGIIAILYWCVDKVKSIRLAWMILFSDVINKSIKNIMRIPRPFETGVVIPIRAKTALGYSFPSGHTQSAVGFWGGSMLILKSKASVFMGIVFIMLTALSRLYLGLHWPMDVVGGILLGIFSVLVADSLLGDQAIINRWHIIAVSTVVLVSALFPVGADFRESIGALWGMTCGVYIEQKYINFKPIQRWQHQVIKVIVGIVGIIIIYMGLKQLFPKYDLFNAIRYAIVFLWITAGAPYLFKGFIKPSYK